MEAKLREDVLQFMRVFERLSEYARRNNGSLSDEDNALLSYAKYRECDFG